MKKGIIVTSFGTTYKKTRELSIEPIEDRIRDEYKDRLVIRAFTSRMVIKILKERDNYPVDTPTKALERMKEKGIKDISIQPLLIIEGFEYEKLLSEVKEFSKENKDYKIRVGKPLLSCDASYDKVSQALHIGSEETAVFMGHGSEHRTDKSYEKLESIMRNKGFNNVFIGTVEGKRSIDDLVSELEEKNINKVSLKPLMLVAGDHAVNDMASDDEGSWKSILKDKGIEADIEVKGLGEVKAIQDIFINNLELVVNDI